MYEQMNKETFESVIVHDFENELLENKYNDYDALDKINDQDRIYFNVNIYLQWLEYECRGPNMLMPAEFQNILSLYNIGFQNNYKEDHKNCRKIWQKVLSKWLKRYLNLR